MTTESRFRMQERLPARRLEREIGVAADEWRADHLIDLARERGVRIVSLMHVGADGWLKTLDFVPRSSGHLRDVIEGGERADGSSLFAATGIRPDASDVLLRPRLETAFLDPFSESPALVFLCGHAGRDGQPLPESPDTILRRAHERLVRETGIDLHALGEVEYFLGRHPAEADIYGADERGYHASSPFVFGERLRRRALSLLAEIGVPIKYGHSEVGYIASTDAEELIWEQHEIELALAPLPEAAEGVALTQWVLRNLAHAGDMRCSFDPIMRRGHAGSGLHFHFAPRVDGAYAAIPGREGRRLMAALVSLGPSLMTFGNRHVGSFIRLSQAKEAPSGVAWGEFDRSALVRIPVLARSTDGRTIGSPTIEFRLPDGSAQPWLLLAAVAQGIVATALDEAAVDDLLARTHAARIRENPDEVAPLPRSFREIAEALEHDRAVYESAGVFPSGLIDLTLEGLRS